MRILSSLLLIVAAAAGAHAHPGHPDAGSPIGIHHAPIHAEHVVPLVALALLAAAAGFAWRRIRGRNPAR